MSALGLLKGIYEREENYLYTVSELLPIDPELIADCLSSENDCEFFKSKKSDGNKVIVGFCIYNKESLYAFLHGKYNGQINGHVCYWQNIQKDLYNQELISKTMIAAIDMENNDYYAAARRNSALQRCDAVFGTKSVLEPITPHFISGVRGDTIYLQ